MTDTSLKIINATYHDTTLQVKVANNGDWPDQHARPDQNFQGQVIKSHSVVECPQKIKFGSSNAWFTVTANFTDGSSVTFSSQLSDYSTKRVNQCSNGYLILEDSLSGILILTIMPYSYWMGDKMHEIGNRTLRHICLPGSHDAGMCMNEGGSTQKMTIQGQLAMGVRYFDLHVIKGSGKYYTGHYQLLFGQIRTGGRGLSFDDIIAQINDFTSYCKSEVIILTVSHSMDTDSGYEPFNQQMWEDFFDQLGGLNELYTVQVTDLTRVELKDFVKNGRSAVVVVVTESLDDLPSTITWDKFPGIHQGSTFPMYYEHTNTSDLKRMAEDQLTKKEDNKTKSDDPVFVLSWTLNQEVSETAGEMLVNRHNANMENLANMANSSLNYILPACSTQSFPNIILLDYLFPDLPVLPICFSISNYFAVDDNAAGYVLVCSPKRQTQHGDGQCFLDADNYLFMSDWTCSDYTMWKMQLVNRSEPFFKLINYKTKIPVSAGGEPNRSLTNQETGNDFSKWLLRYFPSPLYGYDYESALFCLINLSYLEEQNEKFYMDAGDKNNSPFINASTNAPWLPVCDYNASNVWRFDKPI